MSNPANYQPCSNDKFDLRPFFAQVLIILLLKALLKANLSFTILLQVSLTFRLKKEMLSTR